MSKETAQIFKFMLFGGFLVYSDEFAYGSDYSEEAISILSDSDIDLFVGNSSFSYEDDLANLRFVNVIWRGGIHNDDDRNSLYTSVNLDFPEARGHLTKLGKRQMYELGRFLRIRYGAIFNSTYDPFAVRYIAGDKNRSIDSGLMVTAGMFPPREQYEVWNPHLLWQPIAVHVDLRMSVTGGVTTMLEGECPNFQYITDTEEYQNLTSKWSDFVDFLCSSAGTEESNFLWGYRVAKTLEILIYYNETSDDGANLPDWATSEVVLKSKEFFWDVQEFLANFQEINTVAAGYILDAMIGEMKDHVKWNTTRRFHGFSSHVDILHSFLHVVSPESLPARWPSFGGFITLELHKAPKNETIVKVWLWNNVNDNATRLAIRNCDDPCTLENFEKRSTIFMSDDYKGICGIEESNTAETSATSTSGLLCGFCVASMVVCMIFLVCCLRAKKQINRINFEKRPLIYSKKL